MLDVVNDTGLSADRVTVSQLEAAANFWSLDTFARSSLQPLARRYSFDVPTLPRLWTSMSLNGPAATDPRKELASSSQRLRP